MHGLRARQSIHVEAKDPASDIMVSTHYRIDSGCNSVRSEKPLRGPGPARELPWSYSVVLRDANYAELARIDPEIVIKDDP